MSGEQSCVPEVTGSNLNSIGQVGIWMGNRLGILGAGGLSRSPSLTLVDMSCQQSCVPEVTGSNLNSIWPSWYLDV